MSSDEDINVVVNSSESKDSELFQRKSKLVRVLIVLAYILSVSMAAILLSIYYIFMWHEQSYEVLSPPSAASFHEYDNVTVSIRAENGDIQAEMQQQNDVFSTAAPTTEESTTPREYDLSIDDLSKTSALIKKLVYKYPYAEND